MKPIDINPNDLCQVQAILRKYVPEYDVWVFGSRVQWTAKKTSDLDLAVITDVPLDTICLADLKEALSQSDLPFKVDVVDWAVTGEAFRKIITREYELIQISKFRCVCPA
ncbi:MAG: nucleotidyltransferase domain-containing protein [Nitrospirota bacterium]